MLMYTPAPVSFYNAPFALSYGNNNNSPVINYNIYHVSEAYFEI